MKMYVVGGAVRDTLLGLCPKDRDYVVVGATPEEMLATGQFRDQAVGVDFPVFLHKETGEEYALARIERKTKPGYNGFEVTTKDVTLEEDLSRRDLTINAMAQPLLDDGRIGQDVIDPYGGLSDLATHTLRHVSPAFAEDPVRVLRLARFLARYGQDWSVAPETVRLCRAMIEAGELDALTPDRVFKEFEKGLSEPNPELMLQFLIGLGCLELAPFEVYRGIARAHLKALQAAVSAGASLPVRFALAVPGPWDAAKAEKSKVPTRLREVSHLLSVVLDNPAPAALNVAGRLQAIEQLDGLRQLERFDQVLEALSFIDLERAKNLRADQLKLRALDLKNVTDEARQRDVDVRSWVKHKRLEVLAD